MTYDPSTKYFAPSTEARFSRTPRNASTYITRLSGL